MYVNDVCILMIYIRSSQYIYSVLLLPICTNVRAMFVDVRYRDCLPLFIYRYHKFNINTHRWFCTWYDFISNVLWSHRSSDDQCGEHDYYINRLCTGWKIDVFLKIKILINMAFVLPINNNIQNCLCESSYFIIL